MSVCLSVSLSLVFNHRNCLCVVDGCTAAVAAVTVACLSVCLCVSSWIDLCCCCCCYCCGCCCCESTYIDVLGNGDLTSSKALEQGGLSGTVGSDKTVTTTKVEIDIGVRDQLTAVETEGEGLDLDIAGEGLGSQDTGRRTIASLGFGKVDCAKGRGEAVDLIIVAGSGSVAAVGAGGGGGGRGLLGSLLGGLGCETLLLRGGEGGHDVGVRRRGEEKGKEERRKRGERGEEKERKWTRVGSREEK